MKKIEVIKEKEVKLMKKRLLEKSEAGALFCHKFIDKKVLCETEKCIAWRMIRTKALKDQKDGYEDSGYCLDLNK